MKRHLHFVTGKLAAQSLRDVLAPLAEEEAFDYTIDVLPITVAALMTPAWIAKRMNVPESAEKVVVPGYCGGDLAPIEQASGRPVERGPKDLRRLAEHFGRRTIANYGAHDIEIIAEINHAPRLSLEEILVQAASLRDAGADRIDVGCIPGEPWSGVGDATGALVAAGHRVSIDSFDPGEVAAAAKGGASLVLSVNSANCKYAADWGIEVVVIPDDFATLGGLDETIATLRNAKVPFRIDPILEPIGFGFAASLARYYETRRRWPDCEMMMGIGNLTELTDVDSAGVNVLLLAICQELGIRSVLTTQVIHWAKTSVRECDLARRLVHYAITQRALPKHVEPGLVMLRNEPPAQVPSEELERLAGEIKDHNYRIIGDEAALHLVAANMHLSDDDPFLLFEKLLATKPTNIDASHAFYLGYELCKARIAMTLGKRYEQDVALNWGLATEDEAFHRLQKGKASQRESDPTEREGS